MIICTQCQNPIEDDSSYCRHCGSRVESEIQNTDACNSHCGKCGSPLLGEDVFCRTCGSARLVCPECKTPLPPQNRFCTQCGIELVPPQAQAHRNQIYSATAPSSAPALSAVQASQPRAAAHVANTPSVHTDENLPVKTSGAPGSVRRIQNAPTESTGNPSPAAPSATARNALLEIMHIASIEPSGLLGGALVFGLAALLSWAGWYLFSLPGRLIRQLIDPGDCGYLLTGSFSMYLCSAKVGLLTLAGPLASVAVLIVLRRWIAKHIIKLSSRLPQETRFLLAPLVACIVFAFSWAPIHYEAVDDSGLVSQRIFPAIVALFAYSSLRYGAAIQKTLLKTSFFARRDNLPTVVRWLIALLIPLIFSLAITFQNRVSEAALKEQIVTLLALFCGYLALTPRQGDLLLAVHPTAAKVKGGAA